MPGSPGGRELAGPKLESAARQSTLEHSPEEDNSGGQDTGLYPGRRHSRMAGGKDGWGTMNLSLPFQGEHEVKSVRLGKC